MLAWHEAKPTRREIPIVATFLLWIGACPFLFFPDRAPLVTAVLAVGLLVLGPGLTWRGGQALPATPLNGFLLVYLLLSAVAFLVSPLPDATLHRLTTLFAGAVGYGSLLLWLEGIPERKQALALGLALAGGMIAFIGLFTIEWPSRYLINLRPLTRHLPHLSGEFAINHNAMAGVLLLLLPLSLALWQQAKNQKRSRGAYLLVTAVTFLMVMVFLLTQSRNAFLAALLAALAAWAWGRLSFHHILLLFVLLLVLPFIAGYLPDTPDHPLVDFLTILDRGSKWGPAPDQSWLTRLEIWKVATHVMIDYPVLGNGLYTFAPVSRANEVYQTIDPTFKFSHAHNLFLQTGTSLGWGGWLTTVGLWGTLLYVLWQMAKITLPQERWLFQTLVAVVTAYLVFNSFDVLALEQRAGLATWMVLGLSGSVLSTAGPSYWRRSRRLWVIPLLLWLLLSLTPGRAGNAARLQLDRVRLSAEGNLPDPASLAGDARRLGLLSYLRDDNAQAIQQWQTDPKAVSYLQGQGRQAHLARNEPAEAIKWYTLALALDDREATVYFYRGMAHQALGAAEKALADYRQAVAHGQGATLLHGENLRAAAWEGQGQVLVKQGAWQAAAVAFNRAVTLAPHKTDYHRQLEDVLQALAEQEAQGLR